MYVIIVLIVHFFSFPKGSKCFNVTSRRCGSYSSILIVNFFLNVIFSGKGVGLEVGTGHAVETDAVAGTDQLNGITRGRLIFCDSPDLHKMLYEVCFAKMDCERYF